jgi:hypothetical protein
MTINDAIVFAIQGSLTDYIEQRIPNYQRGTSLWLEKYIDESLQMYPVPAHRPAIFEENGVIYIEPSRLNLLTKSHNIDDPVWIKGSGNVQIRPDISAGPYGSYRADRLVVDGGIGVTQELRRVVHTAPAQNFMMSAALRLRGGEIGPNDKILIRGEVAETIFVSLSELGAYRNKWRMIELPFVSGGKNLDEVLPDEENGGTPEFNVVSVSNNIATLSSTEIDKPISTDALVGGQITFDDNITRYLILGNTAYTMGGTFNVTIGPIDTNLANIGVTSANKALLMKSLPQEVELVFYIESTLSLDIGAVQIEESSFRTSMSLQGDSAMPKDGTFVEYRDSPIAGLSDFGILIELDFWRGDGNIVDIGNFKIEITNGNLLITVSPYSLIYEDIPADECSIYVQVSSQKRVISLYINAIFVAQLDINDNFVGDTLSNMVLTSHGVRAIRRLIVVNRILLDDGVLIGEQAASEIDTIFNDHTLFSLSTISSPPPTIDIGSVEIPAMAEPIAQTFIGSVSSNTRTITVVSPSGFVNQAPVLVVRRFEDGSERIIGNYIIESMSSNNILLDSVVGIKIDDILIYGPYKQPGQASVRFHVNPIDPQIVLGVNPNTKKISLDTVGAFAIARAFVRTVDFQEIAEILIEEKDEIGQTITVDSVDGISTGMIITQPYDEMLINPANYFVQLADPINGIGKPHKYTNGVVFFNYNDVPVEIRPIIQVLL